MPGSSVHGISQARILEWVAISAFRAIFLTQGLNLCLSYLAGGFFTTEQPGKTRWKYTRKKNHHLWSLQWDDWIYVHYILPEITQLKSNRDRFSLGALRYPKAYSLYSVLLPLPSDRSKDCPGHSEMQHVALHMLFPLS